MGVLYASTGIILAWMVDYLCKKSKKEPFST